MKFKIFTEIYNDIYKYVYCQDKGKEIHAKNKQPVNSATHDTPSSILSPATPVSDSTPLNKVLSDTPVSLKSNYNNKCKTKKQLNKLNYYFSNNNVAENESENKSEIENENNLKYDKNAFLEKINKYKKIGLRLNNRTKVKVYNSIFNEKIKDFTSKYNHILINLHCLLEKVKTDLFELRFTRHNSVKLLEELAKFSNNGNNNDKNEFNSLKRNLEKSKTLKQGKNTSKGKTAKVFTKITSFFKPDNVSVTHKDNKENVYNYIRKKILTKFAKNIENACTSISTLPNT